MTDWRKEYRRCEHCRGEYRPTRKAQSYCNSACKRAAAYGRERFEKGTKGPRRRRLEASDTSQIEASGAPKVVIGMAVAGSVRNGPFPSIKSITSRGGYPPVLEHLAVTMVQDSRWPHLYRVRWPDGVVSKPANRARCKDAIRRWGERRRIYAEAA